ncbi:MAG TPA: YtxH domain-containing protein [Bryobacteraceae bacterium]|jgi:gas vesicle protein|nr:YtxH domain-containing protein [Bryobacteraceae bacterium]
MEKSDRLVWFLTGAALGAAVALLYAPQSGKDTRRYLGKKAKHGREVVSDVSREALDKGRELYQKGRKMADDAADLFERGRRLVEG